MIDPYLYPESDVLRNLADIRNEETLRDMQNKRMNEHVGILQKKLCIFTKVYFSNTLYLTSKIVYTMPEMNKIIV